MQENVTKNLRDGQLTIKDGVAETVVIALDEGDLSYTEDDTPIEVKDRGVHSHLREGDEIAIEISFSIKFTHWTGTGAKTSVSDAFNKEGGAAAWVTTNTDGGDVFTVDLEFNITDPDGTGQKITFSKVAKDTMEFVEGDEYNKLTFSGKCYGGREVGEVAS